MLYCPRCNREYKEGVQRFCIHDGGRLVPKAAAQKPAQGGVFSNLVSKINAPDESDEILSLPNFVPKPTDKPAAPNFIQDEEPQEFEALYEEDRVEQEKPEPVKAGKQVNISELPSFQAPLGDRKRNPTGRLALSWENPNVLLGHVVRGRYFVEQRAGLDDVCITYLAQDRAANNKRVIFKVLSLGSAFIENASEERIALSHLNHPHIVKILDSGEMPEGMPFAVFEYVEGRSLRELLDSGDHIAAADTGKIVKQVSEALSGASQNGVLHYDVRPQKIILKREADGTQIARLTDFALAKGYKAPSVRKLKDVAYQSPEQLQGREISPASESYSLAAIAYEMLIGRLPFNFESMRELLDAQKRGLTSKPRMVKPNLPPAVDDVFTRALTFDPDARFQKARDFGEALSNALASAVYVDDKPVDFPANSPKEDILSIGSASAPVVSALVVSAKEDLLELTPKAQEKIETAAKVAPAPVQATPEKAWEKHPQTSESTSMWAFATMALLALVLIGAAIFAYFNYFAAPGEQQQQAAANTENNSNVDANANTAQGQPPVVEAEDNPPPRVITPPENSTSFQNTKDGLLPELLKNFRGFSLYYPSGWTKNAGGKNFLDISKKTEDGFPIEQMLVSWYESKGIFTADEATFPKLAAEVNRNWSKEIPNFKAVSQGARFINNNRRVYEVKFEGKTDDNVSIWGRTLFMPPGKYGMKNGLVITMLATSHSPDVKSLDDVGTKGELEKIIYTFEPDSLDVLGK